MKAIAVLWYFITECNIALLLHKEITTLKWAATDRKLIEISMLDYCVYSP